MVALLFVVVALAQLPGTVPGAVAAEPILQRVVGTIGEGAATNVGQRPQGLAVYGNTMYVSDGDGTNVVRAIDLVTGQERIVAGNGVGARLDRVPATTTMLYDPKGLATDAAGNLYIAEGGLVRKLDSSGVLTTVAGSFTYRGVPGDGGPATQASLSSPEDLAFDAAGNLYIADWGSNRIRKVDTAGIITTVAGNGTGGFSGDGGPATAAQIYRPVGVAVDSHGNVYIAENEHYRVRRVDAVTGIITTFAGTGVPDTSGDGGPASEAGLADPRDIAFDRDGNVYIADTYGYRIRKVDAAGTITAFAGNGGWGNSGDGGPAKAASMLAFDLVFDGAGNLYFADSWLDKVRRIDGAGIVTTVAGNGFTHHRGDGGPALDAQTHAIQRVAIDPVTGQLAFADTGTGRVRTVNSAGVVSTVYEGPKFDFWLFSGFAYDPAGNLYVGERYRIRRIDRSGRVTDVAGTGEYGFSGDGGPATEARINLASSITFDRAGNLYFSDMHNVRIRKVTSQGIISTVAGSGVEGLSGDGGPATAARFMPWYGADVVVDDAGNIYLADSYNDRIRKVDPSGIITSVGAGQVRFPTGMALDGLGRLFVASSMDHKVRVMAKGEVWSTVAGNGTAGFGGEGGPATSAQLALSGFGMGGDVTVDQNGTLFIGGWQRIWKVEGVAAPVALPTTTTTTRPPAPATLSVPFSVWSQAAPAGLDGVGTWIIPLNEPAAGAGQVAPEYLYGLSFGFAASGARGVVGLMATPGGPRAMVSVTPPSGAPQTFSVDYPWRAGRAYFVLLHQNGPGVWAALVYDQTANAWTLVASVPAPPAWGRLAPTTVTGLFPTGAPATSCAASPSADFLVRSPTSFVAGRTTDETFVQGGSTAGTCPALNLNRPDGWIWYGAGAR